MNKLIESIKAIYLRHPYLFILTLSALLTLPWITLGEFYTKGEPREASVATCILNTGNWILPADYADEVAYKPPFMHWLIAIASLPTGEVSETTARIPSALGLIGITLMFFTFLYKRKSKCHALLATLILLTSFEMHRSGIEARVDMFLTFFMVGSLLSFFKWEEKGLKGYPVLIPLFLGGAAMVKGPVGILLPCLVFGIYLLILQRYSLWKIIIKNVIVALPALAILSVWYVLAYQQGGAPFLNLVYAENFGRFLGSDNKTLGIAYELGHKGPFWYYIPAIILGFMPWSLLLIFSAFAVSYKGVFRNIKTKTTSFIQKIAGMDKVLLFSIISVVIILLFYAIPSSKRSVYIMPAYPFAAYLLMLLYEWAVTSKPKLIKLLSYIILVLSGILLSLVGIFHFVNLQEVSASLIHNAKLMNDISLFSTAFQYPTVLGTFVWFLLLAAFITCLYILKKKTSRTILFGTLTLYICIQFFLEGFAYPVFKNGYSTRPFAEKIEAKYDLKGKTFVTVDLKEYPNLYGLSFYMGNDFKNFDKELPLEGYFITGSKSIEKINQKYNGKYAFEELERTTNKFNDFNDVIIVYKIIKTGNN